MKPSRESLSRLLRLARSAPPSAPPPDDVGEPLPLGTATGIAARWVASGATRSSGTLWERLSYAGLAVALLVCGAAYMAGGSPAASAASIPEDSTLPDLFHATIAEEPSA